MGIPRKLDIGLTGYDAVEVDVMGGGSKEPRKAQYNIRVDEDLLEAYREFCARNGLDPQAQIIHFMRRLVQTDLDLQDKLWEALRATAR